MFVLSLISLKGGAGRTTLATILACEAVRSGQSVLIIGSDEEVGGINLFQQRRQRQDIVIRTIDFDDLDRAIRRARSEGFDIVIVDCPRIQKWAVAASLESDFVLLPMQPAALDLHVTANTISIIQTVRKPFSVVLNFCDSASSELPEVEDIFRDRKWPLAPILIHKSKSVVLALCNGQSVREQSPNAPSAREYAALYRYLEPMLASVKLRSA